MVDLVSTTFKYPVLPTSAGTILVSEYENMRPDLVSDRIYATQDNWDVLLKYNGVSNPFSLESGETMVAPSFSLIGTMVTPPLQVLEKGTEPTKRNEDQLITPRTAKDTQRLASIRSKTSEVVPPNVNLTGTKNVESVNGEFIFGANMTQTSTASVNQSTTRTRVQSQLKNNTTF